MKEKVTYYFQRGIPIAQVVVKGGFKTFPLFGILTIIFVIAKIFDKIEWSWFMVFWPIWIAPAIVCGVLATIVGIVILIIVGAVICDIYSNLKRKWKRRKKC